MDQQIVIRLDQNTKTKLAELARAEGKNTSTVVRDLIKKYVANKEISTGIDKLWMRIGSQLQANSVTDQDISSAIKMIRGN